MTPRAKDVLIALGGSPPTKVNVDECSLNTAIEGILVIIKV